MAKKNRSKRSKPTRHSKSDDEHQPSSVDVAPSESQGSKHRGWRLGLSALVVLHLMAVALPPLAMQADGAFGRSPSVDSLLSLVSRYGEFLYLDRGYAFFAPDPGPSHLIQALVTQPNGDKTETLYPDRDQQWPRLNYHRHFMITEFLSDIYEVPSPPQELLNDIDPIVRQEARDWERRRKRYEIVRQSITDHLKPEGGEAVIGRRERLIPTFVDVARGMSINDPQNLTVMRDVPLIGPPETVPAPPTAELDTELHKPVEDKTATDTKHEPDETSKKETSKKETPVETPNDPNAGNQNETQPAEDTPEETEL